MKLNVLFFLKETSLKIKEWNHRYLLIYCKHLPILTKIGSQI